MNQSYSIKSNYSSKYVIFAYICTLDVALLKVAPSRIIRSKWKIFPLQIGAALKSPLAQLLQ